MRVPICLSPNFVLTVSFCESRVAVREEIYVCFCVMERGGEEGDSYWTHWQTREWLEEGLFWGETGKGSESVHLTRWFCSPVDVSFEWAAKEYDDFPGEWGAQKKVFGHCLCSLRKSALVAFLVEMIDVESEAILGDTLCLKLKEIGTWTWTWTK